MAPRYQSLSPAVVTASEEDGVPTSSHVNKDPRFPRNDRLLRGDDGFLTGKVPRPRLLGFLHPGVTTLRI